MNNRHAAIHTTINPSMKYRINQHYLSRARHQLNSRPGIFNDVVFVPSAIDSCIVNPFLVVNLNCNNLKSVSLNLVTLPVNLQGNQKIRVKEPLMPTPFLCFFLSPIQTETDRTNMYYIRQDRMQIVQIALMVKDKHWQSILGTDKILA